MYTNDELASWKHFQHMFLGQEPQKFIWTYPRSINVKICCYCFFFLHPHCCQIFPSLDIFNFFLLVISKTCLYIIKYYMTLSLPGQVMLSSMLLKWVFHSLWNGEIKCLIMSWHWWEEMRMRSWLIQVPSIFILRWMLFSLIRHEFPL